jgi:predicted nucleic acid-binding protein
LSEEQLRQALIRISQFVLRGNIKEIRDELQDDIVEMAFYWSPKANAGILKEQVAQVVSEEFPLIKVEKSLLDDIVERLGKKGSLEIRDEKYYLSSIRRRQLETQAKDNLHAWERIYGLIASGTSKIYGTPLSKEQREAITTNFNTFLATLFIERADIIAELLTAKEVNIKKIRLPFTVLDNTIGYMKDFKLRKALKETIIREFRNPSEEFAAFLFQVSRNLVCIQVLNLDPECQSIEEKALKDKVLFLDTNMLMALLCERMPVHELAKECTKMSQSMGIKLVYSERTLQEYRDVLERSKAAYQQLKISERFLELVDNEFIAAFGLEKKANRTQSWEGFYYRLKHPQKLLEREFGVGLYDKKHKEIIENPLFEEIAKTVSECYQKIRGRGKEKDVAEHDAYHLLLMRELRTKESTSLFGPKHWFVTLDQTLYCVDDTINEKMNYTDKTPSNVTCDIWIETVSPFLTLGVQNKKAVRLFAEILSSHFAVIPFHINTKDLMEIQGDWVNYKWLETKDLVEVLNDKFVRQAINQLSQAREKGEATEEFASKLGEKVKVKLDSILEAKIKDLEGRVQQLESVEEDKEKLKQRLQQVEASLTNKERRLEKEERFRRSMRIVAGILGTALIILNIICGAIFVVSGTSPLGVYTVVYMLGLSIIGGILILIAVAYEQVSAYLGAKVSK